MAFGPHAKRSVDLPSVPNFSNIFERLEGLEEFPMTRGYSAQDGQVESWQGSYNDPYSPCTFTVGLGHVGDREHEICTVSFYPSSAPEDGSQSISATYVPSLNQWIGVYEKTRREGPDGTFTGKNLRGGPEALVVERLSRVLAVLAPKMSKGSDGEHFDELKGKLLKSLDRSIDTTQ